MHFIFIQNLKGFFNKVNYYGFTVNKLCFLFIFTAYNMHLNTHIPSKRKVLRIKKTAEKKIFFTPNRILTQRLVKAFSTMLSSIYNANRLTELFYVNYVNDILE